MKKLLFLIFSLITIDLCAQSSQIDNRINYCVNGDFMGVVSGFWDCVAAPASSGWTDAGTEVQLSTNTDDVEIGSAATLACKVGINGDADEIQFLIQENGTQTTSGFIYENSSGTDLFAIEGGGELELGSANSLAARLAINGIVDETQLWIQGNSTQGVGNYLVLAEQSGGTDVFRVSNGGTLIGGTNAATITDVLTGTATIDFADPGQNNCTTASTVIVTGAAAGDACFIGTAVAQTDVWFECQITAANTCSIRACKLGNVAEDPASGTYRCVVMAF
ncbi:hypothetical protein L0152_07195 [bacterium]|nr:hypothetical protein [bacterium]